MVGKYGMRYGFSETCAVHQDYLPYPFCVDNCGYMHDPTKVVSCVIQPPRPPFGHI